MRSRNRLPFALPFALSVFAALVGSCGPRGKVLHPTFPDGGLLAGSTPPSPDALRHFEALVRPSTRFGDHALTHATDTTLSFFGEANGTYAILGAGCIDGGSRLVLEGVWRDPTVTDTGLIQLFAGPPELVAAACAGADVPMPPPHPSFEGALGNGAAEPGGALTFTFERDRVDLRGRFRAGGHHGACPTIEDCGWSENTIESIVNVEPMGASVVEIDVQLSKDGVPFLFHDDSFGPRLADGEFCHGQVTDFTFAEIRALCTARFGETIPSLAEAIDAITTRTKLREVWLDIKVAAAVAPVIDIMRAKTAVIHDQKRNLSLVIGLPTTDAIDAYKSMPHDGITCLCELDPSDVRALGCEYWGPQYTRGPLADDAASLRADGYKIVYWTIDEVAYIDEFLSAGHPDGMLSDHPGLVMERVQMLGVAPPAPP